MKEGVQQIGLWGLFEQKLIMCYFLEDIGVLFVYFEGMHDVIILEGLLLSLRKSIFHSLFINTI